MPTPEILEEMRQMATRLNEIADMYDDGDSEESEEKSSMKSGDKMSTAMSMFKKKDDY